VDKVGWSCAKWEDWGSEDEEMTWEPEDNFGDHVNLVDDFIDRVTLAGDWSSSDED